MCEFADLGNWLNLNTGEGFGRFGAVYMRSSSLMISENIFVTRCTNGRIR